MTPRDRLLTAWREAQTVIPPPEQDAPFVRVRFRPGTVSNRPDAVIPVVVAYQGKARGLLRCAAAWFDPVTAWLSPPVYVQGNAAVVEQVLRTNGILLDETGVPDVRTAPARR